MKLLRYGPIGAEKPGILDDNGEIRDLSGIVDDIDPSTLSDRVLQKLRDADLSKLSIVSGDQRVGACVGNIGKMICIGLNYSDHAAETGATPPPEPIIFMKVNSAICGPNDDVRIPKTSEKTDWEVELGFVIGKEAKYVSEVNAMEHVAGYCIVNDVSERSFQAERSGQWTKGKSCDTFGPTGPWMVTRDEIPNPQNLKMTLDVNGKRYQDGSTSTMIFGVEFLVHYLSQFFTLYPGDVISTGTPPGVGLGVKPNPVFLKPGDEMRLSIEGLGEQHQKCVAD
jgi:2-keto-4-pentenoate hydratase/2-oxohepta-3-ene-1,7-dioic acid hydratase in catechol pathway